MSKGRLWHLGRLRRSEDRDFLRPGLFDGLLINANQLENNCNGTSAYLEQTQLPYMIDPVLSRLQLPAWRSNERGDLRRNYARLASRYFEGTDVRGVEGALVDSVPGNAEWGQIARNIVDYQRNRLSEQLDLFNPDGLHPQQIVAPALVTLTAREDRLNRLLAESAAQAAAEKVVDRGQHPLDLLLEDQPVRTGGARRRTPTSRATTANEWHYVNARRQEVEAFGNEPVLAVVERDIARAAALAGRPPEWERLAAELRSA